MRVVVAAEEEEGVQMGYAMGKQPEAEVLGDGVASWLLRSRATVILTTSMTG